MEKPLCCYENRLCNILSLFQKNLAVEKIYTALSSMLSLSLDPNDQLWQRFKEFSLRRLLFFRFCDFVCFFRMEELRYFMLLHFQQHPSLTCFLKGVQILISLQGYVLPF